MLVSDACSRDSRRSPCAATVGLMKVEFEASAERPYRVHFSFDKLRHGLRISVDGAPVAYEVRNFSARGWDVKSYTFTVGARPTRRLTLEKWARSGLLSTAASGPKVLAPGLHPQPLRAFVDNTMVAASDHQPADAPTGPLTT